MNCSQCGAAAPAGAAYCSQCGAQLAEVAVRGRATFRSRESFIRFAQRRRATLREEDLWYGSYSPKAMVGFIYWRRAC